MCGRYAPTKAEILAEFFEFASLVQELAPRSSIAPTTQIRSPGCERMAQRELIALRWGLVPHWSRPRNKLRS
jgi:putative SOS response-associated peptidase YedK